MVQFLFFCYLVLTLFLSGFMMVDGMVWGGTALLIGSFLGFVGGSGMRASFYLGRRKGGLIAGTAFAVAGMALVFFSDVVLRIFGSTISADVWVLLGFSLGFLAARREDAGVQGAYAHSKDDAALGVIAPIAAEVVVGRLTCEEAEKLIESEAAVAPEALALWHSMTTKEREELGLDFMRLALNPDFAAHIEKQLAPLKEADPELWNQSLAKAKEDLRRQRMGRRT